MERILRTNSMGVKEKKYLLVNCLGCGYLMAFVMAFTFHPGRAVRVYFLARDAIGRSLSGRK